MTKLRVAIAGLAVTAVGVGGVAVLSAAPAVAGGDNSSLTCSPTTTPRGDNILRCVASDPDGVQTIVSSSQTQIILPCADVGSGTNTDINFSLPNDNQKRVVNINDCEKPRQKTKFVVRADGTVNRPNQDNGGVGTPGL